MGMLLWKVSSFFFVCNKIIACSLTSKQDFGLIHQDILKK